MTNQELYQLVFFIKRPGMYLGNHEIKSIEGFLIGYDMAKNNVLNFQRELIKTIFENYRQIESIAEMEKGNIHLLFRQVEEISKSTQLEELQIFKEEAMKCLIKISDSDGEFRYKEILKKELIKIVKTNLRILNEPNNTKYSQMSEILQLHKNIEEWKGENLKSDIRNSVRELKDLQMNSMTQWMQKSSNINELRTLLNRMINQLKK